MNWFSKISIFLFLILLSFYFYNPFSNIPKEGYDYNDSENRCRMTYMWRRIFFMDIGLDSPHYSLFLYGEGSYAQNYRETGHLNGIPIIFVPGNAGSGRQVRSLGSLLQNKTEQHSTPFHFDTFAVDFNEELTALDMDLIESQADFLARAIQRILSMYTGKRPHPIILVGHSMGGIVIQAVLMSGKFSKEVTFVLSFATPYREAPFYFDKRFLYFWHRMHEKSKLDVKIISVSGGLKDEFIEEDWTNAPFVSAHSFSSALDTVWLDMDHKCILWCNQLVRQTSRLLFDYATNPSDFEKHMLRHYGIGQPEAMTARNESEAAENISVENKEQTDGSTLQSYNENDKLTDKFLLMVLNQLINTNASLERQSWLHVCDPRERIPRWLDRSHMFTLVNLSKCGAVEIRLLAGDPLQNWHQTLHRREDVLRSEIRLNFFRLLLVPEFVRISMTNQLAIVPLGFEFAKAFSIYRLRLKRFNCKQANSPRRAFFMQNNQIRRAEEIKGDHEMDRLHASLLIYPGEANDLSPNEYKLLFIELADCKEYSLQFSVDIRHSLVKALRRNRHHLLGALALTMMALSACLTNSTSLLALLIAWALLLGQCRTFSDSIFALFANVFISTLFYWLCLYVLAPLFRRANQKTTIKSMLLTIAQHCVKIIVLLFTVYSRQTSIVAIFCALSNLMGLCKIFESRHMLPVFASLIALHLLCLLFQVPFLVTYFWKATKYGEWQSSSNFNPFFETNCAMALLTLFLQCRYNNNWVIQMTRKLPTSRLTELILFALTFLVYYRNPACFILPDDLSLLILFHLLHVYTNIRTR